MNEYRQFRYGETVIAYCISRLEMSSPRVRIQVEPDGRVVVQAPKNSSDATIGDVVKRRSRWIHGHLRSISKRKVPQSKRDWVSGESHRYLGRQYMLKVRVAPANQEGVVLAGGQLRVSVAARDPLRVRRLVHAWYRERADAWLRNRVSELATQLPWVRKAPSVAIRQMKTRWGSCSPAGRLTLNPVLIRVPREAVDYVIVHELSHLRHHNHSRSFYLLLARYVPEWRHIKKRLDDIADGVYAEQG
jgi:predicted metal-dependent hydrolase